MVARGEGGRAKTEVMMLKILLLLGCLKTIGAELELAYPNALTVWEEGGGGVVVWQGGQVDEQVQVELVSNSGSLYRIGRERGGSGGRLRWRVPSNCYLESDQRTRRRCFGEDENARYFIKLTRFKDAEERESKTLPRQGFRIRPRKLVIIEPVSLQPPGDWIAAMPVFMTGQRVQARWRMDGIPAGSNVSVSIAVVREGFRKSLIKDAPCWGSTNLTLGKDIPTGANYRLLFESSPLFDSVHTGTNGLDRHAIQLHAYSHSFRVQGPLVVFLSPGSWLTFEVGDKMKIEWELSEFFSPDETPLELFLYRAAYIKRHAGDDLLSMRQQYRQDTQMEGNHNIYSMLRADPKRGAAMWTIPLQATFLSGEYIVVAFQGDVKVGESEPVFIHGFEAHFLYPLPPSVGQGFDLTRFTSSFKLPIRFAFRNPGHLVSHVTVRARKCTLAFHPQSELVAFNVSLRDFPTFVADIQWNLASCAPSLLNEKVCLEISPGSEDPDMMALLRPGHPARKHFVFNSAPFVLIEEGGFTPPLPLQGFDPVGSFHVWNTGQFVKLPKLDCAQADGRTVSFVSLMRNQGGCQDVRFVYKEQERRRVLEDQCSGMKFLVVERKITKEEEEEEDFCCGVAAGPFWIASRSTRLIVPADNSAFFLGDTVPISWVEPVNQGKGKENLLRGSSRMLLRLVRGKDEELRPADEVELSAWHSSVQGPSEFKLFHGAWHVPCNAHPGKYHVLEEWTDAKNASLVHSRTQGFFYILPLVSMVTFPREGDLFRMGSHATITWAAERDKSRTLQGKQVVWNTCGFHSVKNVTVFLACEPDCGSWTLAKNIVNRGLARIKLPARMEESNQYRITVEDSLVQAENGGRLSVTSGAFTIARVPAEELATNDASIASPWKLATDQVRVPLNPPLSQSALDESLSFLTGLFSNKVAAPRKLVSEGEWRQGLGALTTPIAVVLMVLISALALVGWNFRREISYLLGKQTVSVSLPPSAQLGEGSKAPNLPTPMKPVKSVDGLRQRRAILENRVF